MAYEWLDKWGSYSFCRTTTWTPSNIPASDGSVSNIIWGNSPVSQVVTTDGQNIQWDVNDHFTINFYLTTRRNLRYTFTDTATGLSATSTTSAPADIVRVDMNWAIDYDTENAYPIIFFQLSNELTTFRRVRLDIVTDIFYQSIMGSIPPLYTWVAWGQLNGNNGQYRCSLTMIKNAEIGDPSTLQGGDISDFNRLSAQSSIWNLYHNIPLGVETKIAWSGPGWMSLTLTEVPQSNPRTINFQFKFYAPQVSSVTPIFVENRPVAVEGNAALKVIDMFLSFIYDNEQQAALFYPVDHNEYGDYLWGYVNSHTEDEMLYLYLWLNQSSAGTPDTPYDDGTQDNGGDPGNPIPQSHIDVPSYNTSGGLTDNVVTLYRLTTAQLQDIAGWLWSSDFIDNLNKFMGSADECLLSLTALPVKPTNLSTKQFRAGNVGFVVSGTSDPYNVEYVEQRFFKLDMGDFVFTPFWDSYLDFAPYSSIEVYLPGVGVQKLDIDDIACPANIDGSLPAASGSTIHLDYIIDMVTGVLVAFISVNGELRYQFPGKIGYTIPLTGENYTRMIQGYVTATAGLIGTVASGGAAAPFTASAASAGIINAMKPDIYRGGNFSGDASMLSSRKPYLIYRRPNKPELIGQENFTGFPSYKSGEVGDFSGYTEFLDVHVEGLSCTEEERDQILAILKGGVLL